MDDLDENLGGDFWNKRYEKADTPWNITQPSPPLTAYVDQLVDKNIKILIPGAGHAHEAFYLIDHGFTDVTICDISEIAMARIKNHASASQIKLIVGDFFDLEGKYDLIIEQTFFCAITPSMRKRYSEKTYGLLNDGGKLVGLLFDRIFDHVGPPFGGTKEEYENYFSEKFYIQKMEKCYNSVGPRLGHELFFICIR